MAWEDEAVLLFVRGREEPDIVAEVMTARHGRVGGQVSARRGTLKQILRPGARLRISWKSDFSERGGQMEVTAFPEADDFYITGRKSMIVHEAMSTMLRGFAPEQDPQEDLYDATCTVLRQITRGGIRWPEPYARWELALLAALEIGLDLNRCAVTAVKHDLRYISPRNGKAVSREAGGAFADRLLPLPGFLISGKRATLGDIRQCLQLSEFFLTRKALSRAGLEEVPRERGRVLKILDDDTLTLTGPDRPPPPPMDPQDLALMQAIEDQGILLVPTRVA